VPCVRWSRPSMLYSDLLLSYAEDLPVGPERERQEQLARQIKGTVRDHMTSPIEGFMCGKGLVACRECGNLADYLCDMPIAPGKTCDAPLCDTCAHVVGEDKHLCPFHWGPDGSVWEKEREAFEAARQRFLRSNE
jgi:hypothetical protein